MELGQTLIVLGQDGKLEVSEDAVSRMRAALRLCDLASTEVVEIRGGRRRAERPSASLARCAAGWPGEVVIGPVG